MLLYMKPSGSETSGTDGADGNETNFGSQTVLRCRKAVLLTKWACWECITSRDSICQPAPEVADLPDRASAFSCSRIGSHDSNTVAHR
jgi:hypothetical protein